MSDVIYQVGEKWRLVDPEQNDAFEQWIFFDGAYDGAYWYVAGANAIGLQGRIRRADKNTIYGNAAAFSAVNPSPASGPIQGIAYGGGELVAVTQNGQQVSSTDGTSWTITAIGTSPDLRGVDYGEAQFVTGSRFAACANNGIWFRDPTWTKVDSQTMQWWNIVNFESIAWAVVGYDASNNGHVATGVGSVWNTAVQVTTGNRTVSISRLGPSKYIIGGENGYVGVSSSPIGAYTDRSIPGETGDMWGLTGLDSNTIVAASSSGKIYRSTSEGVNWTLVEDTLLSPTNGFLGLFRRSSEIVAFGAPEGGIVHSFTETQADETDKETAETVGEAISANENYSNQARQRLIEAFKSRS